MGAAKQRTFLVFLIFVLTFGVIGAAVLEAPSANAALSQTASIYLHDAKMPYEDDEVRTMDDTAPTNGSGANIYKWPLFNKKPMEWYLNAPIAHSMTLEDNVLITLFLEASLLPTRTDVDVSLYDVSPDGDESLIGSASVDDLDMNTTIDRFVFTLKDSKDVTIPANHLLKVSFEFDGIGAFYVHYDSLEYASGITLHYEVTGDIGISTSSASKNVLVGKSVNYTISLTNYVAATDVVMLNVEQTGGSPASGWDARFSQSNVTLLGNGYATTTLTIDAPTGYTSGEADFTITATSDNGGYDQTSITATILDGDFSFTLLAPESKFIKPNDVARYTFVIQNTGDTADRYTIQKTSENGWGTYASSLETSTVMPGYQTTVVVEVSVPDYASDRSTDRLTLKVTSQSDDAITAEKAVITKVTASGRPWGENVFPELSFLSPLANAIGLSAITPEYAELILLILIIFIIVALLYYLYESSSLFKMTCPDDKKDVTPGDTAVYEINVIGNSRNKESIKLTAENMPPNWKVKFNKDRISIGRDITQVKFSVTAPWDAKQGTVAYIQVTGVLENKANRGKKTVATVTTVKNPRCPICNNELKIKMVKCPSCGNESLVGYCPSCNGYIVHDAECGALTPYWLDKCIVCNESIKHTINCPACGKGYRLKRHPNGGPKPPAAPKTQEQQPPRKRTPPGSVMGITTATTKQTGTKQTKRAQTPKKSTAKRTTSKTAARSPKRQKK